MSMFYGKNVQNIYLQKKYYGHIFLMPPENYIEYLKKLYVKFKHSKGPKSIVELKKFALEEAKKASAGLNFKKKKKSGEESVIMRKEDIIKLLKAVYDIIDPHLVKINHNFKNERRRCYEDNDKYMEIIKTFEQQKINLITFTLKSVCKVMKLQYSVVQESVFHYIQKNDEGVINMVNSFTKIGKIFALAPKKLTTEEVLDILKFYSENLTYLVINSHSGRNEYTKYTLIFINDLIYENYGLEEEQIFAYIDENNLADNSEINNILISIRTLIKDNLCLLFDL